MVNIIQHLKNSLKAFGLAGNPDFNQNNILRHYEFTRIFKIMRQSVLILYSLFQVNLK